MTVRSIALAVFCALQGLVLQAQSGLAERPNGRDPLNPCGLGSTVFANWIAIGETIAFTNALPDGGAMEGVVRDAAGHIVYRSLADGNCWSWKPDRTGFYKVRFMAVQEGVRRPVSLVLRVQEWERIGSKRHLKHMGDFPRDEFAIAVSPAPPREPKDAPPKFGYNVRAHLGSRPVSDLQVQHEIVRLLGMNANLRLHYFRWDEIERTEGVCNWTEPDRSIRYWLDHGYTYDQLLVNVFGTPDWLSTAPTNRMAGWYSRPALYAPREMKPVQRFFKVFCERYRGLRNLEVWNEPHLPGYSVFWQDSSPEQFVDLLTHACRGVREADPSINVVMGGIGMRYLPFYERIVPLGAVDAFDTLATHGGYDMRPFRAVERRHGVASKPYWEDEWHVSLYNCADPNQPDEEESAFRMLSNLANLLHTEPTRIFGFGGLCGTHVPETAKLFARCGGIQQVCGLFRDQPITEPRFVAFALRTATDLFAGDICALGAWRFGEDGRYFAVAQSSDRGPVAFVWTPQARTARGSVPAAFVSAAKTGCLLDWEGNKTTFEAFEPRRMYYLINPDLNALRTGVPTEAFGHTFSTVTGYSLGARMRAGYGLFARPTAFGSSDAAFLPRLHPDGLRLSVSLPKGETPVSLGFVADAEGRGELEDVLEFRITPDGAVVKLRTPQLRGDIPSDYSPANVKLTHSTAVLKNGVWTVDIWRGDLFPFAYSDAGALPFSLVLQTDRGRHTWGGGWTQFIEPSQFGLLVPSGGARVLATAASVNVDKPFGDAEIGRTSDGVVQVRATGGDRAAGFALPLDYIPGSRLMYRGKLRGKVSSGVEVACWCSFGKDIPAERRDGKRLCGSDDWMPFSGSIDMPPQSKTGVLRFFSWRKPEAVWEVRDLEIVNE